MSKKAWLFLGIATEVFHLAFAFGVLVAGRLWLPGYLVNVAITLTVMGQIIFLWCPLSVFSNYCFRKANPDFTFVPSITLFLYKKFGPWVGVPIFAALMGLSLMVGIARFH